MAKLKRYLVENACYHLITKGTQKQKVFNDKEDFEMYLGLLRKFKKRYGFHVYAWCLMPNHVHLLGEIEDSAYLPRFMHDLNMTYTHYFNRKYSRSGHLWQSRYKSMTITKDQYLIDCLAYIEYNPMRANIAHSIAEYTWNSYRARALGEEDSITEKLRV